MISGDDYNKVLKFFYDILSSDEIIGCLICFFGTSLKLLYITT